MKASVACGTVAWSAKIDVVDALASTMLIEALCAAGAANRQRRSVAPI